LITPVDGPGGPGGPGDPAHDPDDPLAVLLRPAGDRLAVPPGRFAAVRRSAARRRTLRAVAGAGLTCGALLAVLLPLRLPHHGPPAPRLTPVAPATAPRHASPTPVPSRDTGRAPSPAARPTPSRARRAAPHSPDDAARGRTDSPATGTRSAASPRG
jgi:hypothetical protein